MADSTSFTKLVPGFEFLQGLMKSAGSSMPGLGQWIAPTLDPDEIDKRIEQLRTVLFWLEQNARLLNASIHALEVQRMTMSTLRSMNMPIADIAEALKARVSSPPAADPAPAPARAPAPVEPAAEPAAESTTDADAAPTADAAPATDVPPVVDPMQWWGALTRQFGELAAKAMKDVASETAAVAAPASAKEPRSASRAAGGTAKRDADRASKPGTKQASKRASKRPAKKAAAKKTQKARTSD